MCGIFAYLNYATPKSRSEITNIIVRGIQHLEYRGYDSSGLALQEMEGQIEIWKKTGRVKELISLVQPLLDDKSTTTPVPIGLGHTRWATHGIIHHRNTHPQSSSPRNEFVVVHNGILTNYRSIKEMLESKGYNFYSDTDTEAIAVLCLFIYQELKSQADAEITLHAIVSRVALMIDGASAIVIISAFFPGEACAFTRGSSLIVGVKSQDLQKTDIVPPSEDMHCPNGEINKVFYNPSGGPFEFIIASDNKAIIEHTHYVIYLEDNDLVHFVKGAMSLLHLPRVNKTFAMIENANIGPRMLSKITEHLRYSMEDYPHYMLKEIHEQVVIFNTMRGRINFESGVVTLGGLHQRIDSIRRSRRFVMIGCGSSYNAMLAVRPLFDRLIGVPVAVESASDMLDRGMSIFRDDCCIFVSQSGETADVLRALEYCKQRESINVGVTNVVDSMVSRWTNCGIHLNAGPEIGVASTKTYTAQIVALTLIVLRIHDRISNQSLHAEVVQGLALLPEAISKALSLSDKIQVIAKKLGDTRNLIILGRGYQLATCLEGALKIKEIAYIHTEGLNTGELNHGPLALVEPGTPIIIIATKDSIYENNHKVIQQILCRKGRPIVICTEGDEVMAGLPIDTISVPHVVECLQSIINVIPLQLLAYYMATNRGIDVDKPRNLAKSITV